MFGCLVPVLHHGHARQICWMHQPAGNLMTVARLPTRTRLFQFGLSARMEGKHDLGSDGSQDLKAQPCRRVGWNRQILSKRLQAHGNHALEVHLENPLLWSVAAQWQLTTWHTSRRTRKQARAEQAMGRCHVADGVQASCRQHCGRCIHVLVHLERLGPCSNWKPVHWYVVDPVSRLHVQPWQRQSPMGRGEQLPTTPVRKAQASACPGMKALLAKLHGLR